MDESPKQKVEEARPNMPLKSGIEKRVDYEYIRNGVVNVFMTNKPLTGKRFTQVIVFKTKNERALFIKMIADVLYPLSFNF